MRRDHIEGRYIWNEDKAKLNVQKHGVTFIEASKVFLDPQRKTFADSKHSAAEPRYFCIGKVNDRIMTVRYTYRSGLIRIIGAGYWRDGKEYYEKT
jgi:uncharacterized DUF497 family protein